MTEAMVRILEMLIAQPEPLTAFAIARQMPMDLGRVQRALDEGIAYGLIVMEGSGPGPFFRYRAKTLEDLQAQRLEMETRMLLAKQQQEQAWQATVEANRLGRKVRRAAARAARK